MAHDLVIRGGIVVTADGERRADVGIRGERISAVGDGLEGATEIDARGLYVMPGAIDGHVHMRTERARDVYDDTFATGSVAAAFGGVTTMIDQAQVEPGTTLADGLDRRLDEARGQSIVDYALHVNLREASYERIAEIPTIAARGCPSFKFFMVYESYHLPDEFIFAAMRQVAGIDGLSIVHAESHAIIVALLRENLAAGRTGRRDDAAARPSVMEGEAVRRALALASVAGTRTLIFHLSAAEGVRELEAARRRGQEAFGEACVPYLLLGPEALDDPVAGSAFEISPPLRSGEHRDALWAALASGAIDIVSTDHGPRRRVVRADGTLATPAGTSSVEVRLALVHEFGVRAGRLTRQQWVEACCTRPAELFRLESKGRLEPGYDADVVLFDPELEVELSAAELHSDVDHSTYEGVVARGFPVTTIRRGEVLVRDRVLVGAPGGGRFLERDGGPVAPGRLERTRELRR
jgi:dihydropyrimidinase